MQQTHQILVTVDSGSIKVEPDSLAMHKGAEVAWRGTNSRKFSIRFENEGPFGRSQLAHAHAVAPNKAGRTGRFKYSVISEENPGLVLDPEIIVHDPPTSPNP